MSRYLVVVMGLLLFSGVANAELKIGFVSINKVMGESAQMKGAQKAIEKEFEPRWKHLQAQQKEVKALEDKLKRDASIMSEAERRKIDREILTKTRDAKRSMGELREDLSRRRNEELEKLNRQIVEASQALGEEEGFDLLFNSGVLFVGPKADVTVLLQKKLAAMKGN
jgi:outer membrane protein